MKKFSNFLSVILLCGLMTACSTSAPQSQPTEPPMVASIATEAPTSLPEATSPAVVQPETAPAIQHTNVPGTPPTSGGERWGDHSTVSSTNAARALLGDDFSDGKFERPYNANAMDVYFPHLDLDKVIVYPEDPTWVYAIITTVGRDVNNAFTGQYAIELDLDQNGFESVAAGTGAVRLCRAYSAYVEISILINTNSLSCPLCRRGVIYHNQNFTETVLI